MGRFYSPKTAWWKACYMTAKLNRPKQPIEGPISVKMRLGFPRPKSTPKWAVWHRRRPDADNVAKAVLDAMTAAGWWKDDGAVAELIILKIYENVEGPGVFVVVQPLTEDSCPKK